MEGTIRTISGRRFEGSGDSGERNVLSQFKEFGPMENVTDEVGTHCVYTDPKPLFLWREF